MKHYNGFTPQQREKSLVWQKAQILNGRYPAASQCCACGQTEGVIDYHQEDYSEPYGDHIFKYQLCYICHMMVHCRFSAPRAWTLYRQYIEKGGRLKPFKKRDYQKTQRLLNSLYHDGRVPDNWEEIAPSIPRIVPLFLELKGNHGKTDQGTDPRAA